MNFKNQLTETGLLAFLQEGHLVFPPLEVVAVETKATPSANHKAMQLDAFLTLRWQRQTYRFGVEVRRLWTPKAVAEAVDAVCRNVAHDAAALADKQDRLPLHPLILVPYLSDERLQTLQNEGVSGIDLCGNGLVIVPDQLFILRTGFPNRFRWEATIKNVYRKNSAIVARTFLLVPRFPSVTAVLDEIRKRGGEVTLATVSKVCKSLEEDLVIERFRKKPTPQRPGEPYRLESLLEPGLRLLQQDKLLDLLAGNYALPAVSRTFRGKSELCPQKLRLRLAEWEEKSGARVVLTGATSTEAYAVMAREPMQSFYCSDLEGAIKSLGEDLRETDRFANVSLLETQDDFVYFDRRPGLWASPIQTYLELLAGDKRERETAEQVRRLILEPLAPRPPKG